MNKKKFIGRLGALALAVTLISTALMGGTLAKYTTAVSGTSSATVAKFAFDLNGATKASQTMKLDGLFSKTYLDGNVSGSENLVAPGTSGKVKIDLKNEGEVAIQPTFKITEENASKIPLKYAVTASESVTAQTVWNDADDLSITMNTILPADGDQSCYLHWKWATVDDSADTGFGTQDNLSTVKIDLTCTVDQVIPTTTS